MSDEGDDGGRVEEIALLTVEVLRESRDETGQVKEAERHLGVQLDEQTARLSAQMSRQIEAMVRGFTALREKLATLKGRIDDVFTGQHGREHPPLRERVTRLESTPTDSSRRRARRGRPLSRPPNVRRTTRRADGFGYERGSAAQHPARSRMCRGALEP